jgi:O-antigen/teichoic acid export membrane protein
VEAARPRILLIHEGGATNDDDLVGLIWDLDPQYEISVLLMESGPLASALKVLGVPYRVAELPGRRSVPRIPFAARRVAKEVQGDGIALIHAQGTRAALLGTYLSRHLHVPLLWLIRDPPGRFAPRFIGPSCERIVDASEQGAGRVPAWLGEKIGSTSPSDRGELAPELELEYAAILDRAKPPPPPSAPEAGGGFASSRRVARNTLARSAGEIIAKVASVAWYVAIARKLGAEEFGSFIFGISLSMVVLIAAGFGTDQLLAREVSRDRGLVHGLLSNVIALRGLMMVGLIGVLAAIVLIGPYDTETRIAVVLIGIGVGIEMMTANLAAVLQAYERMDLGAVGLVVQRGVTAVVGIGVLFAGGGLIAAAVVFAVGSLVGYVVSDVLMRRVVRVRFRPERSQLWPVLKAGAPIGVATLLFIVLLRLDATLISFFTGGDLREVGDYGAAWRLVEATMFIPWAFNAAMLPWLSRQVDRAELLATGSVFGLKVLTAVLMPIGVGYAVFAPSLIDIIYGPEFEDAVLPLRLLGLMTVLYGINVYTSTVLVARLRPMAFARGVAFVLVFNLALNVALIPSYGADGAAFAALLSGVVLAAVSVRQVWATVGRFSLTRGLGGPLVGGAVMAAIALLAGLPFLIGAVVSTVAYIAALVMFERTFFVNDFDFLSAALRAFGSRRRGGVPAEPA